MQGGLRTSIQIFAWSYRRREGKCRWQSAVDELRPQVAVPAFMESLTIYGLVIALVPAPAVLKTPSSDCHRIIRTRARCLPRCSSSPTLSSSEQDVSGEVLQLRVGGASEEEEESVRSEKCLANRKGFVLKGS